MDESDVQHSDFVQGKHVYKVNGVEQGFRLLRRPLQINMTRMKYILQKSKKLQNLVVYDFTGTISFAKPCMFLSNNVRKIEYQGNSEDMKGDKQQLIMIYA